MSTDAPPATELPEATLHQVDAVFGLLACDAKRALDTGLRWMELKGVRPPEEVLETVRAFVAAFAPFDMRWEQRPASDSDMEALGEFLDFRREAIDDAEQGAAAIGGAATVDPA